MSVQIRAWLLKDEHNPQNAVTFDFLKSAGLSSSKASGRGPDAHDPREPETESFIFELHALPQVMRALRESGYPGDSGWQIHSLSAVGVTFAVRPLDVKGTARRNKPLGKPSGKPLGNWLVTIPAANIVALYPAASELLAVAGVATNGTHPRRQHEGRHTRGLNRGRRRWRITSAARRREQGAQQTPAPASVTTPATRAGVIAASSTSPSAHGAQRGQ